MSTTTNLGLTKFAQGTKPWDVGMNSNLDTLDTAVHAAKTQPLGAVNTVTFSANPVFDLSKGFVHHITLTDFTVTNPTFPNPADGQVYVFVIEQDSGGGKPFAFPSNFKFADTIGPDGLGGAGNAIASSVCVQSFVYLSATNRFIKIAPTLFG